MIAQRTPLRQRRDVGQIIQTALNVYGQHFSVLFRIAAVVIPLDIAGTIFQSSIKNEAAANVFAAITLGQLLVDLIVTAALIAALSETVAARKPEFSSAYDVAIARFWTLAGAVLRAVFHILLFAITVVGIPWAIQRTIRWAFIQQAILIDGSNAKGALTCSAETVIGSWWRTFGILLLLYVISIVPALVRLMLFAAPILFSAALMSLVHALVLPVVVISMTLLYFDLNARKESHDLVSAA